MTHLKGHEGLSAVQGGDKLINGLTRIIRLCVKTLAVLMVLVIMWGILDVVWVIYCHLMRPPIMILGISDILEVFGAFLAVLIAIEIFLNITLYLRDDIIHVKLVIATALMAIARKVIVFDYKEIGYMHVLATSAVIVALGLTYWLISQHESAKKPS